MKSSGRLDRGDLLKYSWLVEKNQANFLPSRESANPKFYKTILKDMFTLKEIFSSNALILLLLKPLACSRMKLSFTLLWSTVSVVIC